MAQKFGLFCPGLAFVFSMIVNFTTLYISQNVLPVFIFFSIQVYLNWYSIWKTSLNATLKIVNSSSSGGGSVIIKMKNHHEELSKLKYWYCDKCSIYTCEPSQHCRACEKCFHYRNHHCFFIGTCIIQRNMGNFILICFYTAMACFYSLLILAPYIHKDSPHDNAYQVLLNFCFPIAFAKFILNGDVNNLLLVTFFDGLFAISILCFVYGFIWKLYCCLTGKQQYYSYYNNYPKQESQSVYEIFGSYGLWNFIFPWNGLMGHWTSGSKHELKNI